MEHTTTTGPISFGYQVPTELFKALAAAQADMDSATKDAKNPHFRSSYATLASVLQAVLPAFNAHGLALSQHPTFGDGLVSVTTLVTHQSGQWFSSTASTPLTGRKDAQAVGSAITYLRRYAAQSIAGLPVEDDDGNSASPRGQRPQPKAKAPSLVPARPKALTPAEIDKRLTDMELTASDVGDYCDSIGRPHPYDMNPAQIQQMLTWLRSAPGKQTVQNWLAEQGSSDA